MTKKLKTTCQKQRDELWSKLIEFTELHAEKLEAPDFAGIGMQFFASFAYYHAPTKQEAERVIKLAKKEAWKKTNEAIEKRKQETQNG